VPLAVTSCELRYTRAERTLVLSSVPRILGNPIAANTPMMSTKIIIAIIVLTVGLLALVTSSALATRLIARGQRSAVSATFAAQRLEQLRVTGCASRSSGTDLLLRSGVPVDSSSWRWVDAGNSHYRIILKHKYRTQQNSWRADSLETEISCLF